MYNYLQQININLSLFLASTTSAKKNTNPEPQPSTSKDPGDIQQPSNGSEVAKAYDADEEDILSIAYKYVFTFISFHVHVFHL